MKVCRGGEGEGENVKPEGTRSYLRAAWRTVPPFLTKEKKERAREGMGRRGRRGWRGGRRGGRGRGGGVGKRGRKSGRQKTLVVDYVISDCFFSCPPPSPPSSSFPPSPPPPPLYLHAGQGG